jgi:hypothetical protein
MKKVIVFLCILVILFLSVTPVSAEEGPQPGPNDVGQDEGPFNGPNDLGLGEGPWNDNGWIIDGERLRRFTTIKGIDRDARRVCVVIDCFINCITGCYHVAESAEIKGAGIPADGGFDDLRVGQKIGYIVEDGVITSITVILGCPSSSFRENLFNRMSCSPGS